MYSAPNSYKIRKVMFSKVSREDCQTGYPAFPYLGIPADVLEIVVHSNINGSSHLICYHY